MNTFEKIIGQNTAIALLKSAIKQDRVAPAYLFTGVDGIGRRLTAFAFAEAVINDPKSSLRVRGRNHPDLMWVEPTYLDKGKLLTATEAETAGLKKRSAPQIRLEQIRAIGQFLSQPPLESKRSLVIIEDAQTMPEAAANGLLKTLEEPGKATIILIAPNISSLLPTLVSRCQRIPFYPLSRDQLTEVLSTQDFNQDLDSSIPTQIMDLAQGSPGAVIADLAQFQTIPAQILKDAQNFSDRFSTNPQQALSLAKTISKELELETQIWLLSYLQNYLWRSHKSDKSAKTIQSLELAKQQLSSYIQPRLVWEVLLLGI